MDANPSSSFSSAQQTPLEQGTASFLEPLIERAMPTDQGKYSGVPTDAEAAAAGGDAEIAKENIVAGRATEPFQIGDDDHEEGEFVNDDGGVAFAAGGRKRSSAHGESAGGDEQLWAKGTVQAPAYRDRWFAVVFLAQFVTVLAVAITFGSEAVQVLHSTGSSGDGMRRLGALYVSEDGGGWWGRELKGKHHNAKGEGMHHNANGEGMHHNAKGDDTHHNAKGDDTDDDVQQFQALYDDDTNEYSEMQVQPKSKSAFDQSSFGSSSSSSGSASGGSGGDTVLLSEAFFPMVILSSILAGPALAILALGFMSRNAALLIRLSLYVSIGLNLLLALFAIAAGVGESAVVHIIFAAILACYAKAVWHRIPYAAANLRSAITAVRANMGVALVAFGSVPASIGWMFAWAFAFVGTLTLPFMYTTVDRDSSSGSSFGDDDWGSGGGGGSSGSGSGTSTETTISGIGAFVIFLYILSLHWTNQVIHGVVRTTIAGVIGTWWFSPLEASSFCSSAVRDSLARSVSYSFGSICFGSLIVAIIETLRSWLRSMRNSRGILRLIAQCLLLWIERIVEYFNKWAFVYVGLYGYSYLEASKSVMTLFRERGWTAIISDNLVNRVLALVSLAIGLLVSLVAVLAGLLTEVAEGGWMGWLAAAAWIGFFVGLFISLIMMGVVSGSVDAIIVCYAEAPMEFKENHPELHREMEDTWTEAWPDVTFTPVAVAVPIGGGGPSVRDAALN